MCLYFFLKASGFQTYQERKFIYKKRNPQTRLKAQMKMKREMERGGEKMMGRSVQFSLERYGIVGAVWQCSRASIESEFLLLNSIQGYHNLKRLLLPREFQMKPSERDLRNARSHNCCLTAWDLSRTLFPDNCLHNLSSHPTEVKTLPLQAFLPQQVQSKIKKKGKKRSKRHGERHKNHPMPF